MKIINIKNIILCTAIVIGGAGCSDILEENPQSQIVPSLFNSPAGVLGGISGVYNDIRSQWGTEGFTIEMMAGTDEILKGASGSGPAHDYNGLNGNNFGSAWNIAFQDINTLNGVLQFGQTIDLPDATRKQYLAQAKFLRGFWYFYLVQTFGDVPLHTEFITVPSQAASRQPVAQIYELIIKDLTEAAADLPNQPTAPFLGKAATKPVAQYLLAKAYLTRGWLNNTQSDFAQAAAICSDIIAKKADFGLDLWADYNDVFEPANDYGKETMFVSDHSKDAKFGYYNVGGGASGGAAQNLTPWFTNWNYPAVGLNPSINAKGEFVNGGPNSMIRDSYYGRPYIRMRPNSHVWTTGPNSGKDYFLDQAFVNREVDSRYDNSFYHVYIANKNTTNAASAAGNKRGVDLTVRTGVDTAVWITDFEVPGAPQFIGDRPFKGIVVPPSSWTNSIFPALKKYMDTSRGANFNDPSGRPAVIYRFADVYMIGAEAYFKAGDNAKAAELINVIRRRSAFRKTNTAEQNAAAATSMEITAADVTLDFILDERTREFFGEWQRWHDLVRTKSLVRRVQLWNPEATTFIKDFHALRPIPQSQIDRVVDGPAFPQNTGY
ncbi:MAG: RagB/SusD family nutrient uptake outer membrane protein [Saprospiraceae bacterium]|nr:RagB/SusD family nutrient uptake outer membrane protein [Saprospiraceae bacterium]HMS68918.1 RagB/SusD family nutrient uptake outer membrane protein [Saprospiraceae bacterium]